MPIEPGEKRDFFISRAGVDAGWATWIARVLREASHTTFVQDEDFVAGRSFIYYMNEGAKVECTLALMSPEYFGSDYTAIEWRSALAQKKLLTVRLRDCPIPPLLAHIVYIDLAGKTEAEAKQALLNGVRGVPVTGAPAAFPVVPAPFPGPKYVSVAKLPAVNPLLVGREDELKKLDGAWNDPAIRLVSLVAFGGVGKTSLAINWWHRNGAAEAARILGWSFYSQGAAEDRQASADPFLDDALREWFGVTDPPKDSWTRGERLAELIRRERTLLILDGLEPIQFPPGPQMGRLKDLGMIALLKELAAHNPGLCVCTSRLPLTDLEDYDNVGVLSIDLGNLTPESGAEYLRQLRVQGPDEELQGASAEFANHALALTLLGNYLVKRRGGDVRKRDTVPPILTEDVDKGRQGIHARRMVRAYERVFKGFFRIKPELVILRTLGLFDRPADKEALGVLRKNDKRLRKLSGDGWAGALENLGAARLIEYSDPDGPLDCHPLIREYFSEEYRESNPNTFREAHARLYEHYSNQAPHWPNTLEEMTPLLYAVYHGCQAGKHGKALEDIYRARILRRDKWFLIRNLGALGVDLSLLASFFEFAWRTPVADLTRADQAWVKARAGYALRSVGRLSEALDLTQAGADALCELGAWKHAAIDLGNLSRLHLDLGNIAAAIGTAHCSIKCADLSGEHFPQVFTRATLGGCFHQSGNLAEADRFFGEAEKIQAQRPERPKLYAAYGYQYCELLLDHRRSSEVVGRATQTLAWHEEEKGWVLQVALDHLSLGRADAAGTAESGGHLDQAVNDLRRAGQLHYLPLGLLARAAHFHHTREFDKAQKDLDEVRILANRCGMRLHLTDYHLEEARLLLAQGQAEAVKPHYEAAEKLVEETGYHRRDPEVAELAAKL